MTDTRQSKGRLEWQESKRLKIQGASVINRLIDHTLADEDLMSASQVNAARVLLNKVMPDLKSIELTGEGGGPVKMATQITFKGRGKDE